MPLSPHQLPGSNNQRTPLPSTLMTRAPPAFHGVSRRPIVRMTTSATSASTTTAITPAHSSTTILRSMPVGEQPAERTLADGAADA